MLYHKKQIIQETKKRHKEWITRYRTGENPKDFMKEYINPRTGKPYILSFFYAVLKKYMKGADNHDK